MTDIIDDLSKLTGVSGQLLGKLRDASLCCVVDSVIEARGRNDAAADVDLGIGTLSMRVVDDEVIYKFVPSKGLEGAVRKAVLDDTNELEVRLEHSFSSKMTSLYKDLL